MLVLPAEAGKDALAKGLQMMWEVAGVFPSTTLGEQKRGFPSRFPSEAEFPERSRRGKPPPLEGCQSFFVPLGN